jgi:tetratricopeptide (TPR) repeat protein
MALQDVFRRIVPDSIIEGAKSLLSKPALLVTLVVVTVVGVVEWTSSTAIIDDFEISSTLSKDGVTPSMVSHTLDARLRDIQAIAGTAMELKSIAIEKPPQFVIPGTGVSLNFLIQQLKGLLPVTQWRVGGSILTLSDNTQTVVRIDLSGENRKTFDETIDPVSASKCFSNKFVAASSEKHGWPELNAQLSCAAEFVLRHTQPYILAVYYKETGEIPAARDLALSIVSHPPNENDHWAFNLLGSIALDEARKNKSAAHIKEAESYFERSEKAYKKLKYAPPFALTYVNQGLLHEWLDQPELAESEYGKAIAEDPAYGISYSNLAALKARQSRTASDGAKKEKLWKEATDSYQQGYDRVGDPGQRAIILTSWARSLADRANDAEAKEKLDSAIALNPIYAEAHFAKGALLDKSSNPNKSPLEALNAFAAAARLKPWNLGYSIRYARSLGDNNRLEESIAEFERAATRDPGNVAVQFDLAKAQADTIKDRPERYSQTLERFYQVYDLSAKTSGSVEPAEDIQARTLTFVRYYLKVLAGTADTSTDLMKAKQAVLLGARDKFLRGGYVFANYFYSDAIELTPEGKSREDLVNRIADRIQAAANNSSDAKRASLVELALQYKPTDELLLTEKFMVLVLKGGDLSEATSFASRSCIKENRNFSATVKHWLSPTWNCPK